MNLGNEKNEKKESINVQKADKGFFSCMQVLFAKESKR